jgi:glycosyltransferase involved in cell wall biosynthesis
VTTLQILVPFHDDPEGFALSLRSIEAQTWKGDRETIVCDDGSSPQNQSRLDEIVARSRERIRVITNTRNRGRPYARNVLLDAADAKYVAWLDAGDEWYPRKVELQLEALYGARFSGTPEGVWCTCDYDWQWLGSRKRKLVQQVDGDPISNLFLGSLRAYLWTILGPTRAFKDVGYFDLNLPRLQDLDFFLRFVAKGGRLLRAPTDEPLCVYHKSDVGRAGREVLRCSEYVFEKHSILLMTHSRRFRRNRRFQQYQLAARFTSNNGETARTALYLGGAAVTNPIGFVRWLVKTKGKL